MNEDALFDVLLGVATAEGSAQKGENYVYKTADAEIVGVLRVLSSGVFVIAVRSDSRRQGIATALLDAAKSASLKPDFNRTTYSSDGQAFIDAYRKEKGERMDTQEMMEIKPCHKTVTGKTLAVQSAAIHFLPVDFWNAEQPECGGSRAFHDKESLVICWDCALGQGVVNETEQQCDDKMERVLDRLK